MLNPLFRSFSIKSAVPPMPKLRVAIFIDGSNLYHSTKKDYRRTDLDLGKFADLLLAGRFLVRVYYYNASVLQEDGLELYKSQQRFFEVIRHLPYFEVRLGKILKRGESRIEKGIDVRIAVDMLTMAHDDVYDVAVLVSGDADYVHAVESVKGTGKHVEVACFRSSRSDQLMQQADRVIGLDDLAKDYFIGE